jgi:carbonic anhydrase
MSQHPALANLLSANAQWAEDVERLEPGFFAQSAKGQSPHTLWIGCADSRVPESVITGSRPGDIFVSRNAGNQVQPHDDNVLAALAYAVDYVGVEHGAFFISITDLLHPNLS